MTKQIFRGVFTSRARLIAVLGISALLLSACASSKDSAAENAAPAEGSAFTYSQPEGLAGATPPDQRKLWTYNKETGLFEETSGDASTYVPNTDRKVPAGTGLAFGDGMAGIAFTVAIDRNLYPLAKKMGFDLKYCDLAFKTEKAISCAEDMTLLKPKVAVVENWQAAAAEQMMKIYNDARVPVITVDLPHPNAIYFGVNGFESGIAAGKAAGEFAKTRWNCKDVWIYLAADPIEGATVDLRMVGFANGIQSVCGVVPANRIVRVTMDQQSPDQELSVTTDWLTANPTAKHILASNVDGIDMGIAKAFVQTGRDGWDIQQGCDDNGIATLKSGDVDKTHMIGCIAFHPDNYPKYFLSIAADIAEGKAVPNEVNYPLEFFNHDNISQLVIH